MILTLSGLYVYLSSVAVHCTYMCPIWPPFITQPTPPFNAPDQEYADISLQLHSPWILCQGVWSSVLLRSFYQLHQRGEIMLSIFVFLIYHVPLIMRCLAKYCDALKGSVTLKWPLLVSSILCHNEWWLEDHNVLYSLLTTNNHILTISTGWWLRHCNEKVRNDNRRAWVWKLALSTSRGSK